MYLCDKFRFSYWFDESRTQWNIYISKAGHKKVRMSHRCLTRDNG